MLVLIASSIYSFVDYCIWTYSYICNFFCAILKLKTNYKLYIAPYGDNSNTFITFMYWYIMLCLQKGNMDILYDLFFYKERF